MFMKLFLLFTLFWTAGNRLPANGLEQGCLNYYNRSLKKNIYTTWEVEPEFPGGAAAYLRFLNKNLWIAEDTVDDVTSLPMPRNAALQTFLWQSIILYNHRCIVILKYSHRFQTGHLNPE